MPTMVVADDVVARMQLVGDGAQCRSAKAHGMREECQRTVAAPIQQGQLNVTVGEGESASCRLVIHKNTYGATTK